jgi:hypothetical protein
MKYTILLLLTGAALLIVPLTNSRPSFNGTNPGCDGGGCHVFEDGILSVSVNGLDVQITLSGSSGPFAGELVDASGTVVAFNDVTNSNPFTLTAPAPGNYVVNAGYSNDLKWDSSAVNLNVTSVGNHNQNPILYKLYDNYPNPFNPSTMLRYSVPEETYTVLKIYNSIGREVITLVNETKPAGIYSVEFSATDLASGTYYYTLQAGSFIETKKMLLIK